MSGVSRVVYVMCTIACVRTAVWLCGRELGPVAINRRDARKKADCGKADAAANVRAERVASLCLIVISQNCELSGFRALWASGVASC